jgi:hypothetical protein
MSFRGVNECKVEKASGSPQRAPARWAGNMLGRYTCPLLQMCSACPRPLMNPTTPLHHILIKAKLRLLEVFTPPLCQNLCKNMKHDLFLT